MNFVVDNHHNISFSPTQFFIVLSKRIVFFLQKKATMTSTASKNQQKFHLSIFFFFSRTDSTKKRAKSKKKRKQHKNDNIRENNSTREREKKKSSTKQIGSVKLSRNEKRSLGLLFLSLFLLFCVYQSHQQNKKTKMINKITVEVYVLTKNKVKMLYNEDCTRSITHQETLYPSNLQAQKRKQTNRQLKSCKNHPHDRTNDSLKYCNSFKKEQRNT
jgi:hypothetical protein